MEVLSLYTCPILYPYNNHKLAALTITLMAWQQLGNEARDIPRNQPPNTHAQFVLFYCPDGPCLTINMALLGSGTVQLICDAEQCEIQVSQVTPSSVASMFEVCYIERCYYPTGLLCGMFVDKYPFVTKSYFR